MHKEYYLLRGYLMAKNAEDEAHKWLDHLYLYAQAAPCSDNRIAHFSNRYIEYGDFNDCNVRILNAFRSEGIKTYGDLLGKTEKDLLMIPNLGRKSVNEIKRHLREDCGGLELASRNK